MTRANVFFLILMVLLSLYRSSEAQTAEQNTYARYVRSGSDQLRARNYQGAKEAFSDALRYNDTDAAAHLGLGITYYHLNDDSSADRELSRAAELDPRSFAAYRWLGELSYRRDDLEKAAEYWEKAVGINPQDAQLRARLERIRREHRTEKDFNRDVTSHFLTKYEGREKIEAGKIVLRVLEEAYGEVGRGLSFYPDREIQIILYSNQQFREVTDAPGWSGGIFDGKIRIPIGGIEKETPGLRRLLFHEYTHAAVRAIAPRCPTWLNEGIAQYFEGREITERQKVALRKIAQAGKLPSLSNLEGSFIGLGGNQAAFAYLFSLSSVRYIVDTNGLYRVKYVLDELGAGADIAKAIDSGMSISYEDLDRGWRRSLE